MSATKQDWLRGSFPSWLVAGLLAANCYFVKRYVEQGDEDKRTLYGYAYDHEKRITRIESKPGMLGMIQSRTNSVQ
jgi:hypothetical protein